MMEVDQRNHLYAESGKSGKLVVLFAVSPEA